MARKLIVCMDGTGNEVGDRQTNVLRLYRCLKKDTETQKTIYIPGVGTNDSPSLMGQARQKIRAVCGLAFGLGLEDDVMQAYRFLCLNYQASPDQDPELGDQIFMFGFSRGAYAVRVLAGFIHNVGLIAPHQLHLAPQMFRAYRRITDAGPDDDPDKVYQRLREYGQVVDERLVPIRFLGLFDTVSSMVRFRRFWNNIKTYGSLLELGTHRSVDCNSSVKMVRHALAIDERRSMFRAQAWQPSHYKPVRFMDDADAEPQDVRQMWFPGAHGDVAGSSLENEAGIGKLSLSWILDEIEGAGLHLEYLRGALARYVFGERADARTAGGLHYAQPDPLAKIHPSIRFPWHLLEVFPKSIKRREWPQGRPGFIWYLPLAEPRAIPQDHEISEAATTRRADDPDYDPPNLP